MKKQPYEVLAVACAISALTKREPDIQHIPDLNSPIAWFFENGTEIEIHNGTIWVLNEAIEPEIDRAFMYALDGIALAHKYKIAHGYTEKEEAGK